MSLKRRDFIKIVPLGMLMPKQLFSQNSPIKQMNPAKIFDRIESQASLSQKQLEIFFKNAIVIDALVIARDWDEDSYKIADQTGYTGFGTSLSSGSMKSALGDLNFWNERIKANPDKWIRADSAADFEKAKREGKLAIFLGFQDATMIGNSLDNLETLYKAGTRWIQLTYNSRNLLGDGCTERTNAGLSEFGVEVVKRMNELKIMVDLSHCGYQTTMDGIQFSNPGACFTHTMCETLYPNHPRAKTDEQIKAMSDKGGVMGINALGYMVGPDPGGETTIETYVDHIDHAVNVGGIDHVGLATDNSIQGMEPWATKEEWYEPRLISFKPSYQVRWPAWIPKLDTPDRFKNVTRILDQRGYSTGQIEKILGLNWINYYREVFGS